MRTRKGQRSQTSVCTCTPWQNMGTATWARTLSSSFICSASSSQLVQIHHFQQDKWEKSSHPGCVLEMWESHALYESKHRLCSVLGMFADFHRFKSFIDLNPCMCLIQPNCSRIISNTQLCLDLIRHVPAFHGTSLKTKIKLHYILKITPWVILYSKLFILKQD